MLKMCPGHIGTHRDTSGHIGTHRDTFFFFNSKCSETSKNHKKKKNNFGTHRDTFSTFVQKIMGLHVVCIFSSFYQYEI